MSRFVAGFALLLLLCFGFNDAQSEDLANCEVLDEANFEESVKSANYFVMFYAPWCGHCKRLKPKWNEFCGKMNSETSETLIAAVDCTVESYTCKKHGVSGYPT